MQHRLLLVGGPDVDSRIDLIHYLREFCEVVVAGSQPRLVDRFLKVGIPYLPYRLNRQTNIVADLVTLRQLIRIVRQVRPEIVHAFDTKPAVFARIAAWIGGDPAIVGTLPGLGTLYTSSDLKTRLIRLVYEGLQKTACRCSSLTIFQNNDDLALFVSRGIVTEEKSAVVPGSGVSTDVFDPERFPMEQRVEIRKQLGISTTSLVVTMISRLTRSKGVLQFGAAAQSLRSSGISFLLVGDPDTETNDGLDDSSVRRLKQYVHCTGRREDVPAVLAASDICVLPSYREGIPRVLLEAASMGLPIVTTNSTGCREVVIDRENGFLVPVRDAQRLAEAILLLAGDADLRRRFGARSRELAIDRFDLCKISHQILRIYRTLLTPSRPFSAPGVLTSHGG